MKTHQTAVRWIVFAVAVGLIAGWIASAQEKPRVHKDYIVLPGSAMSKEDEKTMNNILKQYDKSLYRIDVYEKGQAKKTRGTLSEVVIGRKLMSSVAQRAKKTGFTHYAIRIGATEGTGHHQTPTPGTTVGTGHSNNPRGATIGGTGHNTPTPGPNAEASGTDAMDSDELVRRLKPILEKYQGQ